MKKLTNYSIKTKLIAIFIVFKVVPLLLLAGIGIYSFVDIEDLLTKNSQEIVKTSRQSATKTTDLAIKDSIKALDKKSQDILEKETVHIANNVASFLKDRDRDLLFLSTTHINQKSLEDFYKSKVKKAKIPAIYSYDEKTNSWIPRYNKIPLLVTLDAEIIDNEKEFHKVKSQFTAYKKLPIYKEITYYDLNGQEIYKISQMNHNLQNISDINNTYCRAEDYYQQSQKLKKGEIYVSKVIGKYIGSPVIGSFTQAKAKKAGIKFEPEKYGYAGAENPLGQKFEGIIRFVTPVYKNDKRVGYLSLALDHTHIMNFTDYFDPLHVEPLNISDASKGNYAFMWGSDFRCISHPRDYFITGYDDKTGKQVPGWIDTKLAMAYKKSNEKDLSSFLQKQPLFFNQSLKKKPNLEQIKLGQVGLDCRYLNFAPQCQGWNQLVRDGGYGSFIIYWSNVWKLTTAAAIPYYTGQYGNSKIGFGFVTIGANVDEFHKAATQTKEKVGSILNNEAKNIEYNIKKITSTVYENIKNQIVKMSFTTLILILIVIYVALLLSNYITNRIKSILIGTQKLKEEKYNYKIESTSKDEIGQLANSFNEMSEAIFNLNNALKMKLYTDELTGLKNRRAFLHEIGTFHDKILYIIDIDFFRNINDYYGVDAGNFVLKEFANLVKSFKKDRQWEVYRIGSDEFLVLQEEIFSQSLVEKTVNDFNHLLAQKTFHNDALNITTSLNVTFGVAHGEGNILEQADLALNEAKGKKKSFMIFNDEDTHMNRHKENILWRQKIQYAIENDNFVPYYQKIVDVKNPKNEKYECLVRMIDDEKVISPYMFLGIAKETKQYPYITKIMLEKTFQKFSQNDATFSVNLSMKDIEDNEIVELICLLLEKYDIGKRVVFELLESEEISDFDQVMPFVEKMKSYGVRFAIDDFGSGYSNFSYLLQIQPDFIKIDGSLIKNLTKDSMEYHIVGAIVKFAKTLNTQIVAEHVSSYEIVTILKDFDIEYMQGYYFAEPVEFI